MEENQIFEQAYPQNSIPGKKPGYTPSLVLGILSIVFGFLFALAGDILGIIGIILSIVKRKSYHTLPGLICSIVGLAISIVNHIIAFYLLAAFNLIA